MRGFAFGFVSALVLLVGAVFLYLRSGAFYPGADMTPSPWERSIAKFGLGAAIRAHAGEATSPVSATPESLGKGLKLYRDNCAGCHGDGTVAENKFAGAFFPPAPQFGKYGLRAHDAKNFFMIKHGIRWTGMPAWKDMLSDQEIWTITTFLQHVTDLPPAVRADWQKAKAAGK